MLFMPTPVRVVAAAGGGSTFTDDFNRADEDLEDSSDWTLEDGAAGDLAIVSNELVVADNDALYLCPISAADAYIQSTITGTSGTEALGSLRAQDHANQLHLVYTGSGRYQARKVVSGSSTNLINVVRSRTVGDVARLDVEGNDVTLRVNGVQVGPVGSLGGDLSGITGVGIGTRSATVGTKVDNFEAGAL